jgi:gas vesicle protein
MTEVVEEKKEIETEAEAPTPVPPEPPEEKPLFDLGELLKARAKKGEGVSFTEALMFMSYLDNKEERLWRRQQAEMMQRMNPQSNKPNPELESLKTEVSELRKTVSDLLETINREKQTEAQKAFVEGVVKQTTDSIMPELQKVTARLEALESKTTTTPPQPTETAELKEIRDNLKNITDKLGEKVGARGLTLGDVTELINVIETLEKRLVKKEGEVDFKTVLASTFGEVGKEAISAWRDISTAGKTETQPPQPEAPASTMQNIIKRQVQNYIIQRMEAGATTINVQQAANELGLTPQQVQWAYNQLVKEGFFYVRIPTKPKGKVKQTVPTGEETQTEEGTPQESDQVFNPPTET